MGLETFAKPNEGSSEADLDMNSYPFWRYFNKVSDSIHNFGSILLAFILLVIMYQISARFCKASCFDVVELSSYLLVWITFACVPAAHRRNRHIKVDLIYSRLPEKYQLFLDIFGGAVGILLSVLVAWQGVFFVFETYQDADMTLILHIPLCLINLALPLGMIFFAIECTEKILKAWIKYRTVVRKSATYRL
ncbi:MAG: TRAP transporter small permease [Deltaproteobacteria bacterium]|nr:TRAP transporter small permease [Deltaproteobacteria bacterium]